MSPRGLFLQAKQLLSPRDLSLEDIKGISPDSIGLLDKAGIVSVEQLAKMKPDTLKEILDPIEYDRTVNENEIIEQARKVMWLGNSQLKDVNINGLGSESVKRLCEAGITTVEQLAKIKADTLSQIIDPEYERVAKEEELIEQAIKTMRLGNSQIKDIVEIKSESAERLRNAGITTIKQLSKINTDTLRKILNPRYESIADEKEIIEHAEKLREKGNITVEQLAKIKADKLKENPDPVNVNNANEKKIIGIAKEPRKKDSNKTVEQPANIETNKLNENPGSSATEPTGGVQLEDVRGIGPKYAESLKNAEVISVKKLAEETAADDLKEVIHHERKNLTNEEEIIEHAKKLISAEELQLKDVKGIGPDTAKHLQDAGITNVQQLANESELQKLKDKGILGYSKKANEIIERAKRIVQQKKNKPT